ncbi:MAG: hypothetical protein JW913_15535 [Chitinispirillaceae bacterium]|nr:hypothetical protein [Chitinispirillaceae bacterium]
MEMNVIRIGSSRGIRIPKSILQLIGNPKKFTVAIEGNKVILNPESDDMKVWEEAADKLHAEGSDKLVYDDLMDSDHPDWNW